MNRYFQKILKVLKISAIVLLSLFLAVYILIQVPRVQNWLVQQATQVLTEKLQTKVAIQRVNLDFFKTAVFEGVFIEDQQSDTLLFAGKLKADIGIFSLFNHEIFINKIQLENAIVNLSKAQNDSLFNFQFIIDGFSSKVPPVEKKAESTAPWAFGIGKVVIKDTRFKMTDKSEGGFELDTKVGSLAIEAKTLDFANKKIALSALDLEKSQVAFTILKNDLPKVADTSVMAFPAFGWEITADLLQLKDNRFELSNLNYQRQEDVVDYNYLNFDKISLEIRDLILQDTAFSSNIRQASLTDHSGFQLDKLSGEVLLNNRVIKTEKLRFKTPQSDLRSDILLSFNDFGDLAEFMEKVKLEASFENSQIAYRDLTRLVPALRSIPVLDTNIDQKIALDGNIVLQKNNILFESFDSKIGNSLTLNASGSIAKLTSDPFFDLDIKKLITNYASATALTKNLKLPEGLAVLGNIEFSGKIKGTIGDLDGKNLLLKTESTTQFKGDLNIKGLPDVENTVFKASVEGLATAAGDLQAFSSARFPAILDSLGLVKFSGDFEGTTHQFVVTGEFLTLAGGINTDLKMDFEKDYQHASYDGIVEMEEFDLSKILGAPFGLSSFKMDAKGSGLKPGEMDITIVGEIPTFNYRDYTYRNLSLNGAFFKRRFEGIAKADDENLRFNFKGMIDLNDSLPDTEIALELDTINLKALNLYEKDFGLSGILDANLKGGKPENINGVAVLKRFGITMDSIHYSTPQKISLEAKAPAPDQRAVHFRSEFMDADITGKFNLADFPKSVLDFVDGFFPVEDLVANDSAMQAINMAKVQDVSFNFQLKDIVPFAQVFLPDFVSADTASISGEFRSELRQLSLAGTFPNISYGDLTIDTFHIRSKGNPKKLETTVTLDQASSGDRIKLPRLVFHTLFANDTLSYAVNILGDEKEKSLVDTDTLGFNPADQKLDLKGRISHAKDMYTLSFFPEFVLNNDTWKISPKNKIEFDNNSLAISDMNFLLKEQEIAINSRGEAPENDFKPIEVRLSNFNLLEVSEMLGMTEDQFGGTINGELLLKEPKTNLHYNSEILIKDLSYNEQQVGDLDIKATQKSTAQIVDLAINLSGESQMSITGNYAIKEQAFDLDFLFGKVPLFLINPFTKGILKESTGFISGDMKVIGSPEQPAVNGAIKLSGFQTIVDITNTRYSFGEANIQFNEKAIELGSIQLSDANKNNAVLSGKILHNYFRNIRFDLKFNTEALQFLNTTVAENELYYGDLFLKAIVSVKGTLELPVISIDAVTLPKSQLFVQPFTGDEIIKQEHYIIYANPETYNEDSLLMIEKRIVGDRTAFDLSLKLQVTKDATLNIIIDPVTGDQLISVGAANLTVNINPTGVITIAGDYTIERGSYALNYEQLIKRNFEIEKGSTIIFSGDPMNAAFNVTATYKLRTSTYDLVASQSTLSDSEKNEAKVRTDVIVLMKLKGNISNPNITFDIQVPQSQGEGVGSAVNRKLAELRNNPEELNKQAFGLLLFKSFIADSGEGSLSGTGSAIALSSVSSLMSDQLNNFADRYVQGIELDFGLESYNTSGDQSQNVTRMNLNVSKHLFDDRLTINVGTNVNVGTGGAGETSNESYSGIAGDFVVEYQLTENGNYHVKVFHKSDYNVLEQNNAYKSGVGLVFRKSFNGKRFKE